MDSETFTRDRVECSAKLIEYIQHISHGITGTQQISHGVRILEKHESVISEKINCHSNMNKTKKSISRKNKKSKNKEKRNMKLILKLMENLDTAPESKIATSSNPIIILDDLCKIINSSSLKKVADPVLEASNQIILENNRCLTTPLCIGEIRLQPLPFAEFTREFPPLPLDKEPIPPPLLTYIGPQKGATCLALRTTNPPPNSRHVTKSSSHKQPASSDVTAPGAVHTSDLRLFGRNFRPQSKWRCVSFLEEEHLIELMSERVLKALTDLGAIISIAQQEINQDDSTV
uniref:Uncharacterized protein n=1 Tax=Timema genevievae TaxID=629358 RepID=A0A7R9PMY8_TIMGE|nr:unnamed protein product [Timema genevievae]